MISLSKSGSTVTFSFDDNSGYLQNGTIEVPVNSLSLILDESNMATFRKSASNDIFVSANIAEFGMSKSELEAWYKENLVGSTGGTTPEEVQQMIDESISGKADSVSAVSSAEYVSSSTTINFKNVEGTVISSIDASDFVIDGMVDDVKIETISGVSYLVIDFNTASGKEDIQIPLTDIFDPSNYYTKAEVDNTISAATSGKADSSAVTQAISGAVGSFGDFYTNIDDEDNEFIYLGYGNQEGVGLGAIKFAGEGSGLGNDNGLLAVVGKVNESTFNSYSASTNAVLSGKVNTSSVVTAVTSASTDSQIPTAKAVWDAIPTGGTGGGNPTVELTQAEYDALVTAGTVSADTYYIITDATPVDVSQYWTSAQTQSAINQATSGKVNTSSIVSSVTSASTDSEIPTAKAVFDAVEQGGGGGGKAIEAGRGISITTGATADTVSFNLPIYAGTSGDSLKLGVNTEAKGRASLAEGLYTQTSSSADFAHSEGNSTIANGCFSHSEGEGTSALTRGSHSEGYNTVTRNDYEHSSGQYNNSVSGSSTFGDSGNTLFSVGNGTSNNARHNAFEIRQNGDMYLNNGTSDVKLQDYLQIKVVKLTQSAYDALSPNYDPNTLYIIKD